MNVSMGPKSFGDVGLRSLRMEACLTHVAFGRSRSNGWCVITDISRKSLALCVQPFRVILMIIEIDRSIGYLTSY